MIAHNKTLAAQLYGEFREFFPHNAVEYFVSYYDYYQPEAYVPSSDTYIEKDSSVNEHIEQMRLSATKALLERKDSIIVATVSSIYGLGDPEAYLQMVLHLKRGDKLDQRALLRRLAEMQYTRNDIDFTQGCYRVRGDVIDIFPAESDRDAIRVELFDDVIDSLARFDPLTGEVRAKIPRYTVYPGTHYVTPKDRLVTSIDQIREDLRTAPGRAVREQQAGGGAAPAAAHHLRPGDDPGDRLLPGHRELLALSLGPRARRAAALPLRLPAARCAADRRRKPPDDSAARRHVQGRPLAQGNAGGVRLPPAVGARQPAAEVRGMGSHRAADDLRLGDAGPVRGDASRARSWSRSCGPPGLVDPVVEIRPVRTQVDDVLSEINICVERGERVLVTTLTKRMAEDLTEYLDEHGVKVRYLHSDVETVERMEIIRDLRLGKFDAIVGINLLREGLDMPEVSLVAILDADKEGFLRSEGSLIQTIGRAARNLNGRAILYADRDDRLDAARAGRNRPAPRQAAGLQRRAWHHAARRDQGPSRMSWKARGSRRSRRRRGKGARSGVGARPGARRDARADGARDQAAGGRDAAPCPQPGVRGGRRPAATPSRPCRRGCSELACKPPASCRQRSALQVRMRSPVSFPAPAVVDTVVA